MDSISRRIIWIPIFIAVVFSFTAAQIETRTIFLPDSFAGVVNPQCVLYEPDNDKLYVEGVRCVPGCR